ncbi:hypothetical protein BGY98DRAFT_981475, partial [Russula aff. rugulosa BPL654]
MFNTKQQRPTQQFPSRTFPHFYRPAIATSHHDLVPPPDIAQSHLVVPPSHGGARI